MRSISKESALPRSAQRPATGSTSPTGRGARGRTRVQGRGEGAEQATRVRANLVT